MALIQHSVFSFPYVLHNSVYILRGIFVIFLGCDIILYTNTNQSWDKQIDLGYNLMYLQTLWICSLLCPVPVLHK